MSSIDVASEGGWRGSFRENGECGIENGGAVRNGGERVIKVGLVVDNAPVEGGAEIFSNVLE